MKPRGILEALTKHPLQSHFNGILYIFTYTITRSYGMSSHAQV